MTVARVNWCLALATWLSGRGSQGAVLQETHVQITVHLVKLVRDRIGLFGSTTTLILKLSSNVVACNPHTKGFSTSLSHLFNKGAKMACRLVHLETKPG
jgi:hypothetical protein